MAFPDSKRRFTLRLLGQGDGLVGIQIHNGKILPPSPVP